MSEISFKKIESDRGKPEPARSRHDSEKEKFAQEK